MPHTFLRLHALAAPHGDGLRPEILDLFERLATSESGPVVGDPAPRRADRTIQPKPHLAPVESAASLERVAPSQLDLRPSTSSALPRGPSKVVEGPTARNGAPAPPRRP